MFWPFESVPAGPQPEEYYKKKGFIADSGPTSPTPTPTSPTSNSSRASSVSGRSGPVDFQAILPLPRRVGTNSQASLFQWTEDALASKDYPFSKRTSNTGPGSRVLAESSLKQLEKVVQACLDAIDPTAGKIALLIAKDLDLPIAEEECAKLPKLDWMHPYWTVPIEAMDVLAPKMQRAQLQYAHELAIEGQVDVLVTWDTPFLEFTNGADFRLKREVLMAPKDLQTLSRAFQSQYKPYKYKAGDKTSSTQHDPKSKQYERSGFYAVVPLKLHADLVKLAEIYHGQIDVVTILAPQLLSQEQHHEINTYHASRIAASKDLLKQREMTEADERNFMKQIEYEKRRVNTLSAARQKELETQRRFDLRDGRAANADHESQYKWEHWIRMKQMTDWIPVEEKKLNY